MLREPSTTKRSAAPWRIFVVIAAITIGSTALTYWYGRTVIRVHAIAGARENAIARLQLVISTLKDAETGQRGFVITGDENYLAPYNAAVTQLPEQLNALAAVPLLRTSKTDLLRIDELSRAKLAELKETIDLRRTSGFEAAAAVVTAGQGKQAMDELRDLISRVEAEQEKLLTADLAAADASTRRRTAIFAGTALINLLFIGWAYRRIRRVLFARETARRQAEEQRADAQRQREYLSVTLASIGDCVIVTDAEGRISFMNSVAEQVTGWDMATAQKQPTANIFKIINQDTRRPVEDPVQKVMRSGVIVGLANHTLLIRRDGTEIPIDDSGAPIRDDEGNLLGVVLVFRDFSERKQAERELREAKETAEKANRAKDQFLAMLSHELRTPLTPVLTTLSLWEASDDVPPAMQPDVHMLRRSVELEARIIDDLLDLTRIARGMLSFAPENTDVHDLIRFLVSLSQSDVRDKQQRLTLELEAARHHVHTDASRLQQVLWNILRNAVKFTERSGSIQISTSNDADGNIRITVADTGIGMTPEKIARLFVPFEQSTRAGSDPYGGLGLGMSISHALVDLLHGTITAESEGPDQGSVFTVTFPTTEPPPKMQRSVAPRGTRASEGMRILLVEDHGDTARALVRLLQTRGYEVETADSVASGIVKVEQANFDLLLCDIGLPDGTGFELIEHVRKSCNTPALALSGFGTTQDVNRAKQAGFNAHLTKPVNFQKLEATIWQLTSTPS